MQVSPAHWSEIASLTKGASSSTGCPPRACSLQFIGLRRSSASGLQATPPTFQQIPLSCLPSLWLVHWRQSFCFRNPRGWPAVSEFRPSSSYFHQVVIPIALLAPAIHFGSLGLTNSFVTRE